jgi:IS5 family transposase
MRGSSPIQNQRDIFAPLLTDFLNPGHELFQLAEKIPWKQIEAEFTPYYSQVGQPAEPIRLMVGLLLLKRLYNLGDETVVAEWVSNPYYQYFCGEARFQWRPPCDPSDLVHFRHRIGQEGCEFLFGISVKLHHPSQNQTRIVRVDTSAQEKNITYPTDAKLCYKAAGQLWKIAEAEGVQLRQSYRRTLKQLKRQAWFGHHPRRAKKARAALRKMKTRVGRLLRDLERKLPDDRREAHTPMLELCGKVIRQQRKDKNKIYSLHEPAVACIAKGKAGKKYEFGSKVSLAITTNGVIVGVKNFPGNPHDGDTLAPTLEHMEAILKRRPELAVVDRGYRGKRRVKTTRIIVPGQDKPKSEWEKRKLRKLCRSRAGIEPIIGHVKSDCRMQRNYLSGQVGDELNALLAATGFNLRKLLRQYRKILLSLFSRGFLTGLLPGKPNFFLLSYSLVNS